MKKQSSKLESTRKLSKIGPVGHFDFWSKVNAKKSKSTGPRSKSMYTGSSQFQVSGLGCGSSSRAAVIIL